MSAKTQDLSGIQDMGELLDSVEPMKPLNRGDVVEGVVMRSDPEGILVNIGYKAEGLVPSAEMRTLNREGIEPLKVGDEIIASVVKADASDGSVILSIDRAAGEVGWRTLKKALESGDSLNGRILGFNRGGAIVEVEGVQGFVPMSQLVTVSRDNFRDVREALSSVVSDGDEAAGKDSPESDEGNLEESSEIGRELELKVLEVNRTRNRAILSERQVFQAQREERKARLIQDLNEGEVRRGKVTGISNFGAFVDLGGADGLIHISELSWSSVTSPEEVVKAGDEIDVYVLRVDVENKKIALSLKRLQPEPWDAVHEQLSVGDVVDAKVTKLTDFGAFAQIGGSVEGLIHISELAEKAINHPREAVKEGDAVKLKVLRIEPERRRLALSLKQAEAET